MSADLDALYRAPLAEFIERRNTLAARVRGEQGKEPAAAIKALVKPGGTAWVVNQLYWRDSRDFDRLMKAGDYLRDVQQARLAGREDVDMRGAMDSRKEALAVLMARVPELLGEAGLAVSQAMRSRVSTTLEALSIYGGREPGPRVGRLTEDVDPPGFAALAALVPAGAGPISLKPPPPAPASSRGESESGLRGPSAGGHGAGGHGASAKSGAKAGSSRASASSSAGSGEEASPAAPPARPKLRAIDMRRVTESKSAFDRAEAEATKAIAASTAADTARQKAEAAWQKAKAALDEAQRVLDEAMDQEREAEQARDAARKAATTAHQAADKAERLRDQAERAYQDARGG